MFPFYGEISTGYFTDEYKFVEKTHAVFLFAKSFTDAMRKIEEYYGDEIIEINYFGAFEENSCGLIEMDISTGRALIKDAYAYDISRNEDTQSSKEEKVIEIGPNDSLPEGLPHMTPVVKLYGGN